MAEYPINIVLNVSGQGKLQQISQTLQYMRQEGSQAGKALSEVSTALNAMGKGKFGSLSTALKDIQSNSGSASKDLQTLSKSVNEIKGNNLKTISTELKKISEASSQMSGNINKLNFKGLNNSVGTLKSIDSTLKQLLSTVESLKANSNIRLNVTTNANAAKSELQSLNNVRSHTYKTGSRNGLNYYGWGGDYDVRYQKATPFLQASRGVQRMGEKVGLVGANLMMAGSFLGAKELSDTIIQTPAKAETQKYLLSNMQGGASIQREGGGGTTTLYNTLDKVTDQLPVSMQNVVQPLYAFKAASGATAQEINNIIPEFANFGAQVINMTGSEDQAEEAMQKLSRAYQGQYAAVDQYGITKESLEKVGYHEGGTIEEFMAAVTKVTGDARQSMNNFNGLKALVGKDFSRAGKQLWSQGVGQAMNALVGGFHKLDAETGGFTTQLIVAGAGVLNLATTLTTVVGSIGTTIGTFGQIFGNLQAIRKNGGGLLKSAKNIFSGVNEAGIYGASVVGGMYDEFIDTAGMETAVYEGALAGTMQGVSTGTLGQMGKKDDYLLTSNGKSYRKGKGVDLDYLKNATTKKFPQDAFDDLITYRAIEGMSGKEVIDKHNRHSNRGKPKDNLNRLFDDMDKPQKNRDAMVAGNRFFREMDAIQREYEERSRPERARIKANLDRMNAPSIKDKTKTAISNKLNRFEKQRLALTTAGNKIMKGANKAGSAITKGFKKMVSPLSFLASPKLLLGVGAAALVAQAGLSYAGAHSQKVADSYVNFGRAMGHVGEALTNSFGNLFKSIGLSNIGGTEGFYEGLAGSINKLTDAINNMTGHSREDEALQSDQERDTKKKQEADRTGEGFLTLYEKNFANADYYYDPETKTTSPRTKEDWLKVDAMHNQRWWGNVWETGAYWQDAIFKNGAYQRQVSENQQREDAIKAGDINALYSRFDALSFGMLRNYKDEFGANADNRLGVPTFGYATDDIVNGVKKDNQITLPSNLTINTQNGQVEGDLSSILNNIQNPSNQDYYLGRGLNTGASGTMSDPVAVTNADSKNGDGGDAWNKFLDLIGMPKAVSAANTGGEQAALQNAINNPNPNQIPSSAIAGNQQQITPEINTQDGMQKGTDYATQFTQGFQQSLLTTPININNLFGGQNMDLTTKGTEWAGQLVSGFNSGFSSGSLNIGNIGSEISSHNGEVNSAGQGLGKSGTDGFNTGFGDLSGIAGAEAGEIASALRSHVDEVRQAANELAQAAMTGFNKDPNSFKHESPGRLAKLTYAEGDEIVKALYAHVNPLRTAASTLASSAISSFDYTSTGMNANLTSGGIAGLNYSNSLSSNNTSDKSSSDDNRNVVINNNFHIDKIDSKERVKEIAETLVHIMTFNNETAGRKTNIGL